MVKFAWRFPCAHQEAACARPKSGQSDPLFTVFHIATAIEVKSTGEGCTGHTKREASKRRWKHRCDSGDSHSDARASDKRSRSAACFLKAWYCKFMWTLQGTKISRLSLLQSICHNLSTWILCVYWCWICRTLQKLHPLQRTPEHPPIQHPTTSGAPAQRMPRSHEETTRRRWHVTCDMWCHGDAWYLWYRIPSQWSHCLKVRYTYYTWAHLLLFCCSQSRSQVVHLLSHTSASCWAGFWWERAFSFARWY